MYMYVYVQTPSFQDAEPLATYYYYLQQLLQPGLQLIEAWSLLRALDPAVQHHVVPNNQYLSIRSIQTEIIAPHRKISAFDNSTISSLKAFLCLYFPLGEFSSILHTNPRIFPLKQVYFKYLMFHNNKVDGSLL